MLRRRLVPALLLVVPSAVPLSASIGTVQAVEECRLEPGVAAPAGSKWLYRVNRDHRRCWFLSSRAGGGQHTQSRRSASVSRRHLAGSTDARRQDQRRDSDLQPASAPITKTDVAVAVEQAVPQISTPSIDQSSANLVALSVPTIAYKALPATTQTVVGSTVGAALAEPAPEPAPGGATNSNLVLLAGAAAAALFAGATFHLTSANKRRARSCVGQARHAITGSAAAAKRQPLTTDPAGDPKRSMLELKRDLKNALAVSDKRALHRRGNASDTLSLPHAAAWLNLPRPKSAMKQTNRQLADA